MRFYFWWHIYWCAWFLTSLWCIINTCFWEFVAYLWRFIKVVLCLGKSLHLVALDPLCRRVILEFLQSQPAFGSSLFGSSLFGASSQPVSGATSTPAFGSSSTPLFGYERPAFGPTSTPSFGNTGSAFDVSGSSVFGSSSPTLVHQVHQHLVQVLLLLEPPAFSSSLAPAFGAASSPFGFGCPAWSIYICIWQQSMWYCYPGLSGT
uniref:nuclear pore complex protein NUP98A-like n=1 Tax=Erigeron canadensis TaxID=72917 RepID=UPI001CB905AE|nr:nuclear pore complex protein NUP98A-like [Erigeron canadensis]XP_043629704.1 nuclear pore complex protein NUP98A-like [Erigeron canadensis]